VLLPTILIGPGRTDTVSEAMRTIADLAHGSPYFPFAANMHWAFVDVRDAAAAHVRALEAPVAAGKRYLLATRNCNLAEIGRIIRAKHPHLTPPTVTLPSLLTLACAPLLGSRVSVRYLWRTLGRRVAVNGQRAVHDLSLAVTPFDDTVRDAVADLIQMGHVPAAADVEPKRVWLVWGAVACAALGVGVGTWRLVRHLRHTK